MNKWYEVWGACSEEELDNIALLRVMECTNGVIQHAFRDKSPMALDVERTRVAMNFSMTAMKNLTIELGDEVVKFEGKTADALREARDLYVRGFKRGDEEALAEFFNCSEASVRTVGEARLLKAVEKLNEKASHIFPAGTPDWGLQYLRRFLA
jgi:hypothetical protein